MTRPILLAVASLCFVTVAGAQDSVIVIDPNAPVTRDTPGPRLAPEALADAVAAYNDSGAVRLIQDLVLPPLARIESPVATFRSTLRVYGVIVGPVTAINGHVVVEPGGRIEGDILVVGGTLTVRPGGVQAGAARVYPEIAEVYRDLDGSLRERDGRRSLADFGAQRTFESGDLRATIALALGGTYNRVEGLPIYFTPSLRWHASDNTEAWLELRGILRTAPDQSDLRRDLGYRATIGWEALTGLRWRVAASAQSEILPTAEDPLSRSESGWSAFFLQRDYRDHYESHGVGLTVSMSPVHGTRLSLGIRHGNEQSVRASDPWSLLRNSDRWRPNPLIDDGHYLHGSVGLAIDTRNSGDAPTTGWYVDAAWEYSRSDDVAPVTLPTEVRTPLPTSGFGTNRVHLDVRHYLRLSPTVRIAARGLADGWVAGDPLPVQQRYGLGGPDLLPGYGFRAVTCQSPSVRDAALTAVCDRRLAFQAEFRTRLSLGWALRLHDRERRELDRILAIDQADLVFFGGTGAAWIAGSGPGQVATGRIPALSQWKADLGIGADLGGLGLYLAKALTDDEPVRFIVRLQRRF